VCTCREVGREREGEREREKKREIERERERGGIERDPPLSRGRGGG